MFIIRAGSHKMLVWIANREDPDRTASAVQSGSAQFDYSDILSIASAETKLINDTMVPLYEWVIYM